MNGWKTTFLLGWCYASFRKGTISRKLVMILLHISHSSVYQHPSGFRYAISGRQDQGACYKLNNNNNNNNNTQDKPQTPTRTKTWSTTITTTNYWSKHARDQVHEFAKWDVHFCDFHGCPIGAKEGCWLKPQAKNIARICQCRVFVLSGISQVSDMRPPHFWGPDMPILFPQSSQIDSWYRSWLPRAPGPWNSVCFLFCWAQTFPCDLLHHDISESCLHWKRHLWQDGTSITCQLHPCLLHANGSVTSVLVRDGPALTKQKLGHCNCTHYFYLPPKKISTNKWNPK